MLLLTFEYTFLPFSLSACTKSSAATDADSMALEEGEPICSVQPSLGPLLPPLSERTLIFLPSLGFLGLQQQEKALLGHTGCCTLT
jgi:hypothetical protein